MAVEPTGPVVVGVDGSPGPLDAVELAADEALGRVTSLVVIHTGDDPWRRTGSPPTPAARIPA
jgi:hypothetical protein